jgi:branched-chain amino acid transport system permease protein
MITWTLTTRLGVNPLVALTICGPLTFLLGFLLHRTIFRRLAAMAESVGVFEGNSMLTSFGLMFIIQNLALVIWGPEIRGYTYLAQPVNIGGSLFGANRLVTLGFAVVIGLIFYFYLARTRMGKAIRAAAQDRGAAALMGININYVLAMCFALGAAMAGIAGMLISLSYPVNGLMGFEYTTIAIIVVVLGGLGSIPGSFVGGFVLGMVGSVVTYFQPGLALAAYYAIFILLLLLRPTGIMGK